MERSMVGSLRRRGIVLGAVLGLVAVPLIGWSPALAASPTLATQIAVTGSNPPFVDETTLNDTATLSGFAGSVAGETITFNLYGPFATGVTPVCTGAAAFTTTGTLNAGGVATTSTGFAPALKGTYVWQASYPGDVLNVAATDACNQASERVRIVADESTVTIVKRAFPADGQDFLFATTLPGGGFTLDDDADPTFSDTYMVTVPSPGGATYTITEAATDGWTVADIECADGSASGKTATLVLNAGEDYTCTFTNFKNASVTITKDAQPDGPQDFSFTGDLGPFTLDDDADATFPSAASFVVSPISPPMTITESAVAGWTVTAIDCTPGTAVISKNLGTRTVVVSVDADVHVNCTFTNGKDATLTITKETVPASDPQDFDFDLTGTGLPADLDLDTDAGDATLPASQTFTFPANQLDAKTITESVTPGWRLSSHGCSGTGESIDLSDRSATVVLSPGGSYECTFTNTNQARLIIVKDTEPFGDPQDFDFDATGVNMPADFDLDTDSNNGALQSAAGFDFTTDQLGPKTITESMTPSWTLTDLSCTGDTEAIVDTAARTVTVDLDAGEFVRCDFTNTKNATVTIIKATDPASDPQDFDFDLTGAGFPTDLDLDTDPDLSLPIAISIPVIPADLGLHTVTESSQPGWFLTNLQCTGGGNDSSTDVGTRTATLDVDAGEHILCTFTNTRAAASLTVTKVTAPATDPQDFDFDLTGLGVPADLGLDTDAASVGTADSQTFYLTAEQLGAYTVAESAFAGWTLTGLTCLGGGIDTSVSVGTRTATLDIDAGEDVVCTFTNSKDAVPTFSGDQGDDTSIPSQSDTSIEQRPDSAPRPIELLGLLIGLIGAASLILLVSPRKRPR